MKLTEEEIFELIVKGIITETDIVVEDEEQPYATINGKGFSVFASVCLWPEDCNTYHLCYRNSRAFIVPSTLIDKGLQIYDNGHPFPFDTIGQ